MLNNELLQRSVTIIKLNDVLYCRDIHAIDLVNKIVILGEGFSNEDRDTIFIMMTDILKKSNIKFSINFETNGIEILESSWDDFIRKKNGSFITKDIYKFIIDKGKKDLIYNTKLSFSNKSVIEELDLNNNFIAINDGFIDDALLLKRNGIALNSEFVIEERNYVKHLLEISKYMDAQVEVYLNIITGDIDDIMELHYKLVNDKITTYMLRKVKINMLICNINEYNIKRANEYYSNMNTCSYGLLNLFDQGLISKIKLNNML